MVASVMLNVRVQVRIE
ncbi:hypothetical protein LEMLEM_LOCUS17387 [Lemmus lemmus]